MALLTYRARMEGFVVFDYWAEYDAAEDELAAWYRSGELVNCEDIVEGLELLLPALTRAIRHDGALGCDLGRGRRRLRGRGTIDGRGRRVAVF